MGGQRRNRHPHTTLHSSTKCFDYLYITLMSILSVMIYSNRTSQCVEKFISSSLRVHRPILLFISSMCVHVLSAEFAPSLNISQNKWTLEEGDARARRERGESCPLREKLRLGRGRWFFFDCPPPAPSPPQPLKAEAPVSAWGQKSQRHLTNCVSSI